MIVGNINDERLLRDTLAGTDAVVHLAALTSVVDSLDNPQETWEINVTGTFNLLEACRMNQVKRFVFASSNAVTGEQLPPIDEKKVPQPLSPYGASKMAGEALCSAYWHSFGLQTTSLRFANVYGPYSVHKSSLIPICLQRIRNREPITIYGDGEQTRDLVHADDICQAIYLSLTFPGPFGELFQIASGIETSVNAVVQMLQEISGDELAVDYQPARAGEIRRNFSDISKARRILEFEPGVELREGLDRLWKTTLD